MQQKTFTVSAVAGSGSKSQDVTGMPNLCHIHRVNVAPSASGDSYQVQFFEDDGDAAKSYDSGAVTGTHEDPVQNDSGTETAVGTPSGFVCLLQDTDNTGEWHVKVTNNDAAQRDFDFIVDYLPVPTYLHDPLTIATGAVTIYSNFHNVDTEASASSDDLDTINGGYVGMAPVVLRAKSSVRSVVLKDGTGNLWLAGDCTLDNNQDSITLIWNETDLMFHELSRSDNGA